MRVFGATWLLTRFIREEVSLETPLKLTDYLRPAFDKNPMQEAFYCVYLDRKNHPFGLHLITLGAPKAR